MSQVTDLFPWVGGFGSPLERGDRLYVTCPLCHKRKLWFGLDECETGPMLVFKCWVGCNKSEILRSVGKEFRDCFLRGSPEKPPNQEVTAVYRYTDEVGKLLYIKERIEPGFGGSSKTFRVKRPLPDGRWAGGLKAGKYAPTSSPRFLKRSATGQVDLPECRRVLYNLPDIVKNPNKSILAVGGEKDADTLNELGLLATTCDRGESSGWDDSWSSMLMGRSVVVIEDDDPVGKRFANEVVGSLLAGGVDTVSRVKLPDKDATRFVNRLRKEGVVNPMELKAAVELEIAKGRSWKTA